VVSPINRAIDGEVTMILTAGLTPAWQQVLVFNRLRPGEVNRARQVLWCASGKVLNVARALHHLGGPAKAVAPVGGTPGQQVQDDFGQLDVPARWTATTAPTRICTTVVESGSGMTTELVPEAPALTAAELAEFHTAYTEEVRAASVVVLIGSLPPGTPPSLYRELVEQVQGKAIIDARGPELLEAVALRPFLVKPNREELERTLGRPLADDTELFEAMRELNQRGAKWVVVTGGKAPVYASGPNELIRLLPPPVPVVNPIGCGDCLAAGIAWATAAGWEPSDAIRYGLAAAVDKLGRLLPGQIKRDRVDALCRSVTVSRC
jgi:1-phosphofructokinase family hexose kinase